MILPPLVFPAPRYTLQLLSSENSKIALNSKTSEGRENKHRFQILKILEISDACLIEWKRINCRKIARWQHLSRLKASAILFEIFLLGVKKYNNLYLRLVMPSSG